MVSASMVGARGGGLRGGGRRGVGRRGVGRRDGEGKRGAAVKVAEETKFTKKQNVRGKGGGFLHTHLGGTLRERGAGAAFSTSCTNMAGNAVVEKQKSATKTQRKGEGGGGHVPYSPCLVEKGADGPAGRTAEARGQP